MHILNCCWSGFFPKTSQCINMHDNLSLANSSNALLVSRSVLNLLHSHKTCNHTSTSASLCSHKSNRTPEQPSEKSSTCEYCKCKAMETDKNSNVEKVYSNRRLLMSLMITIKHYLFNYSKFKWEKYDKMIEKNSKCWFKEINGLGSGHIYNPSPLKKENAFIEHHILRLEILLVQFI